MPTILLTVLAVLVLALGVLCALLFVQVLQLKKQSGQAFSELRRQSLEDARALRQEVTASTQSSVNALGEMLRQSLDYTARSQRAGIADMSAAIARGQDALMRSVGALFAQQEERLGSFAMENEQKLEAIRLSMERRMGMIQTETGQRLDEMRRIVDEKLQKTLEERMTRSFQAVSQRLEEVYKALGEMQTLASGVGDLKKVLSNVKTRGILGEIQLGAILKEILAPGQYEENVQTVPGSRNAVEFAVKLPAEDGGHVWLPIDSKFSGDAYANLRDAYDSGSLESVAAAWNTLQQRIRSQAKDIRDKYISPPYTTPFGVLFLPFEGLYAEVVSRGMVEILQRDYQVNIAGPSTMAALLSSLQMGFHAFALQKRSGEVWSVLGAVKTEFDKFAEVLALTQQRLEQAGSELDKLVGVRTRQIRRRLKDVTALPPEEAGILLPQVTAHADEGPDEDAPASLIDAQRAALIGAEGEGLL